MLVQLTLLVQLVLQVLPHPQVVVQVMMMKVVEQEMLDFEEVVVAFLFFLCRREIILFF